MRKSAISLAIMFGHGAALGALALASSAAFAQQTAPIAPAPAAAPAPDADADIVVTGSRIVSSGFTAPTPVTVLGQAQLESRALTNVGEGLNELPSFRALVTPATQQAAGGNVGARVLDLRGLGASRTLVLLDGKRFVPSTTNGTIDVNLMPSAIIKRTEVVTGGASAAYGSDAVAGVVNFILDKSFTGFKASTQYNISQRNDAKEYNAQLAYGLHFGGDRGHFIVALEYDDNKGMGDCYTRKAWCPNEQLLSNVPAGANGLPANLRVGPNQTANQSVGGLINTTSGPLRGITFNPDGTTRQYQYGQIYGTVLSPLFARGGEGAEASAFLLGITLLPPVKRFTAFNHIDFEFSDAFKANVDMSFGQVQGIVHGSAARITDAVITRDNAYLPASVAQIMDANGITSFTLGRDFNDRGGSVDRSNNKTYRIVPSFEGKISGSWGWDAYYEHGENHFKQVYPGDAVIARLRNALDAVNVNGKVQCRINVDATTANDDPSCSPVNPFGAGNVSDAAWAYVAPTGYQTAVTKEDVAAANVHGELFHLPGGPIALASGFEYRADSLTGGADALSRANAFWSFNGQAINGKIRVTEGYLEAVAPVLKDMAFANALELNGAVRRTHYNRSSPGIASSSVDATTWKGGIVYEPIEQIRFRATRSRDIRAPNLTELFGPVTSGRVSVIDPAQAGLLVEATASTGANPSLKPEKANTWTAGVVLSPTWDFARSLHFSVDYYKIEIKGAIATLGSQTIVNRCTSGATEFCPLITRNGAGLVTAVQDVLQNVNSQTEKGIDFEASYHTAIGPFGTLNFRALATRYISLAITDSAGTTNRAGQTGYRGGATPGVPDYVVDGNIDWSFRNLSFGVHGHYIPKGKFDALLVGPEDPGYSVTSASSVSSNRVDARFYVDINGSVKLLNGKVELFGEINNLLDKDPPLAFSAQGGTNHVFFDTIGRYFKGGVRVRL